MNEYKIEQAIKSFKYLAAGTPIRNVLFAKPKDYLVDICRLALKALQEQQGREQQPSGWIPVSERLPTKDEYIKNDGRFIVTDGNRIEQGNFDIYADGYNEPYWPYQSCEPIAWQSLPEQYEPQKGKLPTKQKPLTLDELKERDGKQVWVEYDGNKEEGEPPEKEWCYVQTSPVWIDIIPVITANDYQYNPEWYGKTWLAYDREPVENKR